MVDVIEITFGDSTKESIELLQVAHTLVQRCPLELGEEILVTGSVGLGCADAHSDLDMELLVKSAPSLEKAMTWLESSGAVDLIPDSDSGSNEINVICRFAGVWLEAGWRRVNDKEKLIRAVITGQDTSRSKLLQIGNIFHAVPVRTSGALERWQQELYSYPDVVQEQVVLAASEFWTFPHRVEMLWILARRQEVVGLMTWLMADVSDALRILFAVNRKWEMDWKHLQKASQKLPTKPDNLIERVNEIFSAQQLEQRVIIAMQLIFDILKLVPSSYDVTKAMINIQQSLGANILHS